MIARAFPYDRPCRFQKFEATETILATGTTIWKPGFKEPLRDGRVLVVEFFVCSAYSEYLFLLRDVRVEASDVH